ncbi:flagellin N-terminal helical domain-containing protein [Parvularcula lutaonensis]|uniref:Flagellin n=1 Tax=Parvularcula lutaonensis TaxID=491923 RepID=A0ABV7M9I1_9PROT|nr:flagellin [Parvularcula lutaonensis]GGY47158.1 hypothetical protein GCM10007148_15530 [Parvularcula lutaonensis]
MLITNASAQVALKTLRAANASLDSVQSRISTGLKVAKADDNPAFFLVAATQRSDVTRLEGTRENLSYALSAVRTALSAQKEIDNAMINIASAVVNLEQGVANRELERIIDQQIEYIRDIIQDTNYNGLNLLERDQLETFIIGSDRKGSSIDLQTLTIEAQGLGIKPPAVSGLAPPLPGALLDLNSTVLTGSPGNLSPRTVPNTVGVNVGTNPSGGTSERTFAISFETGSDVTTQQVLYEEGGNVRGLNIAIRGGNLVFGGYNLVASDPTPPWPYLETTTTIQPNTRYTAQLIFDGEPTNTGQFRAFLDGALIDTVTGVGILYDHPGGIGVGRINGNAVVNGIVTNRITGPGGNDFQGQIDKIVQYDSVLTGPDFDVITTYLAEGWLPPRGVQYYIGSPLRKADATLIELLEAVGNVNDPGYSVSAALEVLDAAKQKSNNAFSELGAIEGRLSRQQDFLRDLTDAMGEGIASLVEADLAEESARLQATQVQTQLAQQSLLIANQRPQSLLRLFN